MRIAISGGTGFVGRHLAAHLIAQSHEVVLIARGMSASHPSILQHPSVTFWQTDLCDAGVLTGAFARCDAVAHCAGINREIGEQTYQRVHIEGTANVVRAAGVRRLILISFLRARPNCGSPYHESKWAAEERVRNSGLDYTILKCGMIYGRGDHMLDHISRTLFTLPFFATVGFTEKPIRPVPIEDLVEIMRAALVEGRLSRTTVSVKGAEELSLSEAVRRVASIIGRRVFVFPAPVWLHRMLAHMFERVMRVPLVAVAQVRILEEGVADSAPPSDSLPDDLRPSRRFTAEQIRRGLPEPGSFALRDLRCGQRCSPD